MQHSVGNFFRTALKILLVLSWIGAETLISQSSPIQKRGFPKPGNPASQTSLSDFDVLHYSLELRFPLVSSAFDGKADITMLSCKTGLNGVSIHAVRLDIDSVTVSGNEATWNQAGDALHIQFSRAYGPGDTLKIRISYRAAPNQNGFFYYPDCAYTFSEPENARAWFPCRDVPWDKATAELRVTVPAGVKVASIGLLIDHARSADGQWETFHWKTDHPVATYLFCVNLARQYAQWSEWVAMDGRSSLEIAYYVFRRDSARAVRDLVRLKDAIAFYSRQFGPYPFEKIGFAEVEPVSFGGMEHQTMVTFNSVWLRSEWSYESGFIHELAHMWWGDAVTLANWPDIWLNEGFATYAEALFIETMYGPAAFREKIERMKEDYFDQALNRIDFPMYDPPASSFFNYGIVYAKAGLVLHMLRKGVGESIFWRILQEFYQTYCYGNASTEEFQAVCERVSQKPLGSFFRQWVYGKGFPQIAYSHMFLPLQSGGTKVVLQIQQLQESDSPFQMPLDVRLAGIRDTTVWIDTPSEMFVFAVDRMPDSVVIDPDGWLLARTTRLPSGLRESGAAPKRFTLFPPFPNPFNTAVTLYYDVSDSSAASRLSLTVYNLAGQEVAVLLDNAIPVPGMYQTAWNGTDNKGKPLPSGVYVIRMQADAFSLEQKAVLLR